MKNFLCCFVQHGAFHFTAKYWMKIFRDKGVIINWSSNSKTPRIFHPILSKNIKISNAHNFGNTGPIVKIPTLLSSEAWDLSPYKILWILVRVRWKIPILLVHLTWNDPYGICFGLYPNICPIITKYVNICRLLEKVLKSEIVANQYFCRSCQT